MKIFHLNPHDYSMSYVTVASSKEEALDQILGSMSEGFSDLRHFQKFSADNLPDDYTWEVHELSDALIFEHN